MAKAQILELRRCAGVDQETEPAGMVVALGSSNYFVLETSGMKMDVKSKHPGIELKEIDGKDISRQLIDLNNQLMQPDVDPLFREAFLPTAIYLYAPRYFRVDGKHPVGSPGAVIRAEPLPVAGRRAPSIGATLEVLCLDKMPIKIAIRNVQARDAQGNIRYHARLPCDPKKELANMNAIWTPQANVVFDLVSSADLLIDHNDKATREALAKAYGMKDASLASFSPETSVSLEKLRQFFAGHRVKGAHITFFLVHNIVSSDGAPNGQMNSEFGVALIAGTHFPTTFAHEAGHYLGRHLHNGQWEGHEHLANSDIRKLMKGGGSSWAVPFGMVKRVRAFSGKPF